jgi:hypothetical protein
MHPQRIEDLADVIARSKDPKSTKITNTLRAIVGSTGHR